MLWAGEKGSAPVMLSGAGANATAESKDPYCASASVE
jgi:hypothetical protein